ncbi:hypothetical protein SAMN04488516_10517 [Desulfonauticus submarinus]|uniref:Probable membrane transporter protein n=1 Tax=Desulfonauticus submarinus TaxID=206665 RepID=A0A1H0DHE2_9BACT|nr:sulfite exporter TauE/SafE family protein [Desulfonauticus submarinus]SDN69459.1 hypothetical protein SAMN04488516_10517 [Desulfonauticus submarinus]
MLEFFEITFQVSGVSTNIFLPPLISFIVSFFTSMSGVSGAFILLPFQISILHYTSPSVSATNQLFNLIAIPSGVLRYIKEKRMLYSLAAIITAGSVPGILVGSWMRLKYFPDPKKFKFFAGLVLLYIGIKLLKDILYVTKSPPKTNSFVLKKTTFSLFRSTFIFNDKLFTFPTLPIFFLSLCIGIIGGIYGIGGGALLVPFLVAYFKLPIYAIAGATLLSTFISSLAGVIIYQILGQYYPHLSVSPDWSLGFLFGVGGILGMYLGAKTQKYVPTKIIKSILCFCVVFISLKYILNFFIS